jgi:hypothetical protein
VRTLQDELALALASLAEQRTAARIDYQQIRTANQGAGAMVWVEFQNGKVVTGTGFAVRPDATVITNRHVVTEEGTRPRRIGVQFADSEQVFSADVVGVPDDPGVDLVALRAQLRGTVPVIQGFDANPGSARPGAPVAMIGFPMGTRLPMVPGQRNDIVSTTLIAGIVPHPARPDPSPRLRRGRSEWQSHLQCGRASDRRVVRGRGGIGKSYRVRGAGTNGRGVSTNCSLKPRVGSPPRC